MLAGSPGPAFAQSSEQKSYNGKGVVESVELGDKTVKIRHEAISGYMPAMVMDFPVDDTNLLRGLTRGEEIGFHLVVTATHGWIDGITNLHAPPAAPLPRETFEISHAVAPLDEGDRLPDYHFTNELGREIHLSDYKGRAVAITFFFTSCPFPDYCPRLTANFGTVEHTLDETHPRAGWHLFSISFDPAEDTPARLRHYAEAAGYDPAHWSFLTGDPKQINALADQVGEQFWREGASFGHNLRTIVVSPDGHIRRIIYGNKWTPAELCDLLLAK